MFQNRSSRFPGNDSALKRHAPLAGALPLANQPRFPLADRVACRQAIEQVYWQRRTWPDDNLETRPSLDEMLPVADIEIGRAHV